MADGHGGGPRREIRAAVAVAVAVLVTGAFVGVVWGLLAPTQSRLVVEPGRWIGLTGESLHRFDALAIFACLGAVTGLLTAVGAWRLRTVRGPVLAVGLLVGSLLGAYTMRVFGEAVAELRCPPPVDPAVGEIVATAPVIGSALVLIVQPLVASLVVLFLAALSTGEDLGTGHASAFGTDREPAFHGYGPGGAVYGGDPVRYTGSLGAEPIPRGANPH